MCHLPGETGCQSQRGGPHAKGVTRTGRNRLSRSDRTSVREDQLVQVPAHHGGQFLTICHGGPLRSKRAKEVSSAVLNTWVKGARGIPKTFHADNGKEFTAHIAQQLYNKLGIHFSFGWAENHQSNPVERFHQTLYKLINSLRAEGENNFVEGVKTAVMLYNGTIHSPQGSQPALGITKDNQGGEGEPRGEGAALRGPQQVDDQLTDPIHPKEDQSRDDPRRNPGRCRIPLVLLESQGQPPRKPRTTKPGEAIQPALFAAKP